MLATTAQRTTRGRLGTMLTDAAPVAAPLEGSDPGSDPRSSVGRAILATGLATIDTKLGNTGEETDRRPGAEILDTGTRGRWHEIRSARFPRTTPRSFQNRAPSSCDLRIRITTPATVRSVDRWVPSEWRSTGGSSDRTMQIVLLTDMAH